MNMTPLYFATRNRRIKIAKILIDAGASVDPRDSERRTPLHYASQIEMVQILIDAGANVNAKDL